MKLEILFSMSDRFKIYDDTYDASFPLTIKRLDKAILSQTTLIKQNPSN